MEDLSGIHGVICATVTPFDSQGRLDLEAMRQVVDYMAAQGVHGLFVGGTTGEGLSLSLEERAALTEAVVEYADGRLIVIVHSGCITTADTIFVTRHAAASGAAGAAMVVPFYYTFDDASIFQHFVSVAEAVPDLPLFIYAFPGNAKNGVSPGLLRRLRDAVPNIVGVKSTDPDLVRFQDYLEVGGKNFLAFNGVDGLMLPALALGARGQVSGNANAFPELFRSLYDAYMRGDMQQARAKQMLINGARRALKDGLHPAYYKAVLRLRGVPAGEVRAPMREITPQEQKEMERALCELGLI
jgi:4-hydroxy-tetrahydrodipicolinate synthase